jgi:hypothetical protein
MQNEAAGRLATPAAPVTDRVLASYEHPIEFPQFRHL